MKRIFLVLLFASFNAWADSYSVLSIKDAHGWILTDGVSQGQTSLKTIINKVGVKTITDSDSSIASTAKVDVGGQAISIPPPDSFTQASTQRMIQFGELGTIKEDRLLAVFSEAATVEQEAKGGNFQMERYAYVQATRNVEPYQIPLDRFAKYKSDTKAEALAGLSAEDRAELQKNLDMIAKWIKSDMGVKLQIGIPQVGSVAILDETPTTLTMVTTVSAPVRVGVKRQRTVKMADGIALVLVKSKVIWLQLNARLNSRADFDWIAKNIVKWTRAVSASNP